MVYCMFNVILIFGISFIRIVQMNIRALSFPPLVPATLLVKSYSKILTL